MYRERLDFTLQLELLSDLHIGDGNGATLSELRKISERTEEKSIDPPIATLGRDDAESPFLPPTSIKGTMRDLISSEASRLLFGEKPDSSQDVAGSSGRLIQWGGRLIKDSHQKGLLLPYWDECRQSFIQTHVGIDTDTGTADDGKLFFREYIPRGLQFAIDFCWLGTWEEFGVEVLPLFNRMARPDGFSLGAASGAGFGKVRLVNIENELEGKRTFFKDAEDSFPNVDEEVKCFKIEPDEPPDLLTLTLSCEGPFFIADPRRQGKDGDHIDTRTFQRDASVAELLGTSLIGVMRSRAHWLQQTRMGQAADVRDKKYDPKMAGPLSPCQGLFGVNGSAKKLRIAEIRQVYCHSPVHVYPGIQLDDFTQAGILGAVFFVEAPGNLQFEVKLERGTSKRTLEPMESELLELLIEDAVEMGWEIGHSSGVGFGWFEVAEAVSSSQTKDIGDLEDA